MTKLLGGVFINIKTESFMKDNGKMISKRVKEQKNGLMVNTIKEIIKQALSMALEFCILLMGVIMMVSLI
jgi:ascorbate-specific PTS system EIIC-type component UlaA